ncbi:DUF1345 domain-containing protein [Oxalobacteraceae bacterium]|nr:DUF1345 domain-containing protein [Oxalobacteraceae bacterium]
MPLHLPFHGFIRSRPHLSLSMLLGLVAAPLMPGDWNWLSRVLGCWDVAVWSYLLTMGWTMMRADHGKVKRIAAIQDERSAVILATLSVTALMSLVAIVSQLSALHDLPMHERAWHYAFVVATLLGSWFLVGTLFCFHYAHMYYRDDSSERPLAFPDQKLEPDYWDFLYFAFTIAVAAQTADVSIHGRAMRKAVLGQAVLSFFFNLVVLGLSINIAAGLINS